MRVLIGMSDQLGTVVIWEINARWDSAAIRQYLIKAVAAGFQAATLQDVGGNCWDKGGDMAGQKACNVGDVVRVSSSLVI